MYFMTIQERIKQRRSQMLIHSHLYYGCDEPVISDDEWQKWANELVELQKEHPYPIGFYDKMFEDWDGSSGFHLVADTWVRNKALDILALCRKPSGT